MASGLLAGVRVIDFGHYVAGPLAALMLADQGAEVVHVDPKGGPRWAHASDAALNRGKRRVELDLRDGDDLKFALRLLDTSDVLIENFRPGVMDRLGLGWHAVSRRNTRLVYCSLPGFGTDDPRAQLPGWEGLIAAATGNCHVRVGEQPQGWDPERPTYSPIPCASGVAAVLAAFSIVSALLVRLDSGRGQRVEVPLFDAMFELIGGHGMHRVGSAPGPGRALNPLGMGTYRCADGQYVQFAPVGAHGRFLSWFLSAAGHADWAAEGLTDEQRLRTEPELLGELCERLTRLFATLPAEKWERLAGEVGVPLAVVRTAAQWATTDHAQASGQIIRVSDPVLGATLLAGPAVISSAGPNPDQPRKLGDADRDALDAELAALSERSGGATAANTTTARPRTPFAGIRVVDLTQILAGPTSGRLLADLGAEVVKVNAPQRTVAAHCYVNRGKRSILLDISTAAGQQVLWDLLAHADVLIQNFPTGTAERYGIGYEHVRARCPRLAYVSVSSYGAAGPWAGRRGYEVQGQAATGVMTLTGGEGRAPAVLGPYNVLDYGTGVLAAFAAAVGVYGQQTTGRGAHLSTSLTQAGTMFQAALAPGYGQQPPEEGGPEYLGPHALHRYYQAADGWFFVGGRASDREKLRSCAQLSHLAGADHLEDELAIVFRDQPRADWIASLNRIGVAAHPVTDLHALMNDEMVQKRGLSIDQLVDDASPVRMPGTPIHFSETPVRPARPATRPGSDGPAVLAEIGRGDDVESLVRRWVLQVDSAELPWAPV